MGEVQQKHVSEDFFTAEVDGKYYHVPLVVGGKRLSKDEAAELFVTGQLAPVGRFKSYEDSKVGMERRQQWGGQTAGAERVNIDTAFQQPAQQIKPWRGGRAIELGGPKPNEGVVVNPEEAVRGEPRGRTISLGSSERVIDTDLYKPPGSGPTGRIFDLQSSPTPSVKKTTEAMEETRIPVEKQKTFMDEIVLPFRSFYPELQQQVKEAGEAIGYDPEGPFRGALSSTFGAIQYATAPLTAFWRSILGRPLKEVGVPEGIADAASTVAEAFTPGMGVKTIDKMFYKSMADLGSALGSSRSGVLRSLADHLEMFKHRSPDMEAAVKAAETLRKAGAEGANLIPPRIVAKMVDSVAPPDKKIGGIWGNFWEVIEFPFKKRFVPTAEGKKSLAEIFQPAVERLEGTGLDRPFRLGAAKKQLAMKAGEELGADLRTLSPKERLDVINGLKTGVAATDKGKEVVSKFRTRLNSFDFGEEYEKHFRENLMKQIGKLELPEMDNPAVAEKIGRFVDDIDNMFKGKAKSSQVMSKMEDLMMDGNIGMDLRSKLLRLYNLPAGTPLAVAEAARKANRAYTVGELKRAGVVLDEARPGFELVKSSGAGSLKIRGLQGKYVPRDVLLELLAEQDVAKYSHKTFNKWFMTPWKTSKVVLRPATHVRNYFSNLILNDWGGLPVYRQDIYWKAYKELKDKGPLYKEFRNLTGAGGTFTENDIVQLGAGLMMKAEGGRFVKASMWDRGLSHFDKMVAPMRNMYNAEEQLFKVAKYIHNRGKGLEKYAAAQDAMKWTMNYGEVTRATAQIRATAMPFFTWQSKVLPLMAETVKHHPMRVAKWFGMYEGLQMLGLDRLGMNEEEWQYLNRILPEYISDGQFMMMPYRDEKGRLQMLNLTYMTPGFGDLSEMMSQPLRAIFANPFFSLGAAALTGQGFGGMPIYYDWEEGSTKAAKLSHYFYQQIMPSWVPGGSDRIIEKIGQMYNDHPDAPTWYQMAGQELGFKIHAVDEEKAARNRRALQRIHLSEMQNDFVKRLREAAKSGKSDEEIEKIAERFSLLRQRLLEPKEAVGPTAQLLKLVQ